MPETPSFKAPIGTRDVFPPESARWAALISVFADLAALHGYGLAHGPIFEEVGVFQRMGEGTDVVSKEMYEFADRGGRAMALRPDGTASVVRGYLQHRPPVPFKVWYVTPVFRYESPQAGRYRQHHQLGVEAIGVADPELDVETIALGARYLAALGLTNHRLLLNTMGGADDRRRYAEILQTWLRENVDELAPEDRAKVERNPLRVLDSKRQETMAATARAPRITDHLSDSAREHFEAVQRGLQALGIEFTLEPRLVRGLDYYVHTTFEFQSDAIDAAQSTLVAGGRYDGLAEQLGGPPTPGIGFGSGVERVLLACDEEEVFPTPERSLDVFVVDVVGGQANLFAADLRAAGLRVDRAFDGRSMKAQMKVAGRSGAVVAVIVGEQEMLDGTVTVRDLRPEKGQQTVPRAEMIGHIRSILEES